ncbi:sugar nucleotide-binding protein [Pedobacter sp.]|jgi:dTDP-4-dehydrorhamnose reductase|uniref:sugar nucleotide-binding protein n=1 Tax=Pedobacter sp. TaxID=1411316 RepID=UPI002C193B36|nr:sugar nucleotide-binding protein [Pedobacter sp.]HWW42108.1 sugar nucleotide-binding protein [Pedobacter sp.]
MILLTGGSGLLGKELRKLSKFNAPSHKKFDILDPPRLKCDLIIHAAAYTDVVKAEKEREECFNVNVVGTLKISTVYSDVPLVYISTEYAKNPVNWYSRTKQIAESIAMDHPAGCLAIRTLFKQRPWKYDKAFFDQWTLGDYVDKIAPKIINVIKNWDKQTKLIYVGTGRKLIFDLAKESKPDVQPISVKEALVTLQADYL